MEKINIGIIGYGNLGKGVEKQLLNSNDLNLTGIFTRRDPQTVKNCTSPLYNISNIDNFINKIDVMILCGGSATDIITQGPEIAKNFNTVDSFDTHSKIPEYFSLMNNISKNSKHLSFISSGWDPGLFSLNRVLFESVLPKGQTYTFWGKGVSQGHSDALKRVKGVKYAIQYTIPNENFLKEIKSGKKVNLTQKQMHKRDCYVVLDENSDKEKIKNEIINMPNYFEGYETMVHFIDEETFFKNHTKMSHGGNVIRSGITGNNNSEIMEFHLNLESNPEFTAAISVACARAVYRLNKEGKTGAMTILDLPIGYLSNHNMETLRKNYL